MSTDTTAITRSGRLVRLFVGGLPLGLIVMGALSFVIWFKKKEARPEPGTSHATMLKVEVSAKSYQRYQRILSEDIGVRTPSQEENIDAARGFISSSMGEQNMGYHVYRQELGEERDVIYLWTELPGSGRPNDVILVMAHYDSTPENLRAESNGIAALMTVAHAMTGSRPKRTVRFVATSRVGIPDRGVSFMKSIPERGKIIAGGIVVQADKVSGGQGSQTDVIEDFSIPEGIDDATTLQKLKDLQARIEALANR